MSLSEAAAARSSGVKAMIDKIRRMKIEGLSVVLSAVSVAAVMKELS